MSSHSLPFLNQNKETYSNQTIKLLV